jgi:hypothetical protein
MAPLEPGEEFQLCPALAMLPVDEREALDMFVTLELARGR